MLQWMEVPSPEQMSATVRACLARQQQLIDRQQVTAGELSKTEKDVHEELIIHLLESKVQRGLYVKGRVGIS